MPRSRPKGLADRRPQLAALDAWLPRGTACRPTPTCATAAATGAAATAASCSAAKRSPPCRSARIGSRCRTNALHGGIERWFEPLEPALSPTTRPSRACCSHSAAPVRRAGRAALVCRGAPVPHRHHRWHRPAHARRRASRWCRFRRGDPRGARGREGRREPRLRCRGPCRPAFHADAAVDHAAARRRARDPRDHAHPARRARRHPRHAGADLPLARLPGSAAGQRGERVDAAQAAGRREAETSPVSNKEITPCMHFATSSRPTTACSAPR